MSDFEKAIYQHVCIIVTACDGNVYGDKELKPIVKGIAKELLDLARKELQPEFEKEFYRGFSIGQNSNEIIKAYKNGKTEVLNSLPKLEKSTLPIPDEEYPTGFNGKYFCYKGYCIDYKKLFEILPKEE